MKFASCFQVVFSISLLVGCGKKDGGDSGGDTATVDPGVTTGDQPGATEGGDGGQIAIAVECPSDKELQADGQTCTVLPLTEMKNHDDCVTHNGFWYDAADVAQTTAAGFATLAPSCHEERDESCPTSGTIYTAKQANGFLHSTSVTTHNVSQFSPIDQVFSTIRCLRGPNLTLTFSYNDLTEFDGSVNPDIAQLALDENPNLVKLSLAKDASNLLNLSLYHSKVDTSTFSRLSALRFLYLRYMNNVATIDVSKMADLRVIDIAYTQVHALDLSHNDQLQGVDISGTTVPLASLNLNRYTNFVSFGASDTNISSLANVPKANLLYLAMDRGHFPTLDLSSSPNLITFSCRDCDITSLNLSQNNDMAQMAVDQNSLPSIDVTGMTNLSYFSASENGFTSIDLSNNVNLVNLILGTNSLTSIDLSNNTLLDTIDLRSNALTALNLSANTALTEVNVADNNLTYDGSATKWDLHTLGALRTLKVNGNTNLVLDFESGTTISPFFLDPANYGTVYVEQGRWAAYVGADKPAWQYYGTNPDGFYSAP